MSSAESGTEIVRNILKEELTTLKDDLQSLSQPTLENKEDLHTVNEFLDHSQNCHEDNCEVHQHMDKVKKEWLLKGINLGKQVKR